MTIKILLIIALGLLANCASPPPPRGPGIGDAVEAMDGNRGNVPSVNHPNLNPNPFGFGNQGWGW